MHRRSCLDHAAAGDSRGTPRDGSKLRGNGKAAGAWAMKRKLIVVLGAALYALYGMVVIDALYSPKHEQHAIEPQGHGR